MNAILTLNSGSSSVKFSVYSEKPDLTRIVSGQVENLGEDATLIVKNANYSKAKPVDATDHNSALSAIIADLDDLLEGQTVTGVGHRIVHGGVEHAIPTVLSEFVQKQLDNLSPLAPLHQPFNLAGVKAAEKAFPDALQVGCFDTAFHRAHPWVNDTFALPRQYYKEGLRRYGFHGLSYQHISECLRREYPKLAKGRVIVAHLGNGASMCAIHNGVSIGSTMGFSALDGLPMGTRCGQLDPGIVLHLLEKGMSASEVSQLLYKESGLKGLSGISHDMRTLLESDAVEAEEAIEYYVARIQREIGALSAVLGGLDGVVFCGGVGENSSEIRARVLEGMEYFGLVLDAEQNKKNGPCISVGNVKVLVVPTDEEHVIASATSDRLRQVSELAKTKPSGAYPP